MNQTQLLAVEPPLNEKLNAVHDRVPQVMHLPWFFASVLTKLQDKFKWKVPVGYEDETGFHYGVQPRPTAGAETTK